LRKEPGVEAGGPLVVLFATDLQATEARVRRLGGRVVGIWQRSMAQAGPGAG
jgi:predicted enzyme related to lactoylglutathione lyase